MMPTLDKRRGKWEGEGRVEMLASNLAYVCRVCSPQLVSLKIVTLHCVCHSLRKLVLITTKPIIRSAGGDSSDHRVNRMASKPKCERSFLQNSLVASDGNFVPRWLLA